ncbi:serine carboxypeptidase-like 18 [Vitis riparia]|uniref:serine carboxypeptidase-like 18 n=1 Tax=Vitis riparia TaxID=96939 RepID=UPI00155AC942|nr:serine carboxypeptidase-like 18 [Vitis riparia]
MVANSKAMYSGVLLVLVISSVAMSESIIKTLPGFPGDLPFKLETGYVGVDDMDDVQLFYYFIESERNPRDDPLLLWLTGGPGCSAFSGLVYEVGPLLFDYVKSGENLPTFKLNQYSWTKVASMIFLDAPVGTGFSYSRTGEGYNMNDTLSSSQIYTFLRKWLINHPKFQRNQLYISGDSYSGIIIPMVVQEISNGNDAGKEPKMNLQGYTIGNPVTDKFGDLNSRIPFAHRVGVLSDELYEATKISCNGKYVDADPNNAECTNNLKLFTQCSEKLCITQILEPKCNVLSPNPNASKSDQSSLQEINSMDLPLSPPQEPEPWCRSYNYLFSYLWANNGTVQKALHVREGTKKEWARCNESLSYTSNVFSSVDYHRNLTEKAYRALIYSGDHDMDIPYVGTQEWISSLNLNISDDWKPWFVDGQVAGFRVEYSHNKYLMTFATIKGGGHTAPEYKPKECFAMVYRISENVRLESDFRV